MSRFTKGKSATTSTSTPQAAADPSTRIAQLPPATTQPSIVTPMFICPTISRDFTGPSEQLSANILARLGNHCVICLRHDALELQSAGAALTAPNSTGGDLSMLHHARHGKCEAMIGNPSSSEASRLNKLCRSGVSPAEIVRMMRLDGRSFNDQLRNEIQIQVDDCKAQEKWFSHAFNSMGHWCCRSIATSWIQTIDPEKENHHPYSSPAKPPYWPASFVHKNPCHGLVDEILIPLLVHLIMGTPHAQVASGHQTEKPIRVQDLMDALQLERGHFDTGRWNTIVEVIQFREQLEVHEAGSFGKPASRQRHFVPLTSSRYRHGRNVPRFLGFAQ